MADSANEIGRPGDLAFVLTTLPDAQTAEALVDTLLQERLVACGTIVPGLLSIYRWEGRVARESEVLVLLKGTADEADRIFRRVEEIHPYSVPEIVQLPIAGVSRAYQEWILESTKVSA